jgi:hypothetical protein
MSLPAWSFSSIKLFEQCPRKYYHLRVAKDVQEPVTEPMLYGTRLHKAAEDYMQDGVPLPEYFSFMKGLLDQLKQVPGERLVEFKMGLTRDLTPCGFKDPNVWWRGIVDFAVIDREKGEARIVDYKTGKSTKYADTGQLELMALSIFKHFPEIKKVKAGLLFVITNDLVKDKYDSTMEAAMWDKWMKQYNRLEVAYAADMWNPKPSGLCKKHCVVLDCSHNGLSK